MAWDDGLAGTFRTIAGWPASPLWVLAGPGTGKTFALMRRVARILEEGNDPRTTLVVTFTRTAAKDLISQLRGLNVPGAEHVRAGTLHSLCFKILNTANVLRFTGRTPRTLVEFEKDFLLADLRDSRFGGKRSKRARIRAFEAAWARLQHERPGWPNDRLDSAFHRALVGWLQFHEAMLVGELIPETLRYLRNNPACQERRDFQFLLADEYQDLNKAEQVLLDLLGEIANTCVVGDDDQSIYSFKYAHPEGIIEYPANHAGTRQEQLLICRRCPQVVVEMANRLISANQRIQRELRPAPRAPAGEAWAVRWDSLEEEAEGLAVAIAHAVRERGIAPEQVIVLTARRRIGYLIRDEIRARDIPVRSFFNEEALDNDNSREKFLLLSLLVRPLDRVALRCWLGFGSSTGLSGEYARLRAYCEQHNEHPRRVLEAIIAGRLHVAGTSRLVRRFRELQRQIRILGGLNGADLIDAWLPANEEDLEELRDMAVRILASTEEPARILEELRYQITQPDLPESPDSVRVMSLHKSKGLTARLVVIAGCIQGVIPHLDDDASQADRQRQLEEQRRLFYVAITRTSEVLILSAPLLIDFSTASRIHALARGRRGGNILAVFTSFRDELGPQAPEVQRGADFLARFVVPAVIRRP